MAADYNATQNTTNTTNTNLDLSGMSYQTTTVAGLTGSDLANVANAISQTTTAALQSGAYSTQMAQQSAESASNLLSNITSNLTSSIGNIGQKAIYIVGGLIALFLIYKVAINR